jgi:hypothetical protein
VTDGAPVLTRPAARWWNRRRVLLGLAAFWVVAMSVGAGVTYLQRHDTICPDRLPPVAQRDYELGQVQYRCHNGKIVTKP